MVRSFRSKAFWPLIQWKIWRLSKWLEEICRHSRLPTLMPCRWASESSQSGVHWVLKALFQTELSAPSEKKGVRVGFKQPLQCLRATAVGPYFGWTAVYWVSLHGD